MRMDLWSIGIKASDQFPMLDRLKVLLTFDDNAFVRPYCLFQMIDVGVGYVVEVETCDNGSELERS